MLGVRIKLTIALESMVKILDKSSLVLLHSDFYKCNGYYEGRLYMKSVQIRSFFWSVFSEYGEILHISPYSVRMRKKQTRKNSVFRHFSSRAGLNNNPSNFESNSKYDQVFAFMSALYKEVPK